MVEILALHERMLDVALQRNLGGFEQALKRVLGLFRLSGWACIFPPSFQAGGRPLFAAQGVKPGSSPLLARLMQQGMETLFFDRQAGTQLLATLGKEMAPAPESRCRIVRINREKETELVLICYRPPGAPEFEPLEIDLLTQTGRLLDRCFQALAEAQQQEFLAGLFRMVGNLHPEGLCILDNRLRTVFENRKFREHMHLWNHGAAALQNLTLPRAAEIPRAWQEACDRAFRTYQEVPLPPASGKMVATQGPVLSLQHSLRAEELIEGAVRYVAFQGPLGVRPYLMLTSGIRQQRAASGTVSVARVAEVLKLSRRESELAELILRGASARDMGARLKISVPTVKTHIRHVLRKAGVKTRLEFAALCRASR